VLETETQLAVAGLEKWTWIGRWRRNCAPRLHGGHRGVDQERGRRARAKRSWGTLNDAWIHAKVSETIEEW